MINQLETTVARFEPVYRVMLKRIGKGYSAESLSMLIGQEPDYVELVESLILPTYPAAELERIAMALEESNFKSFYAAIHDDSALTVIVDKYVQQNRLVHSFSTLDDEQHQCPMVILREDLPTTVEETLHPSEGLKITKNAIDLLIRGGYFFEAKLPLEIFHSINTFIDNSLSPAYLAAAIAEFCIDVNGEGLLRRIEDLTKGYLYEEC